LKTDDEKILPIEQELESAQRHLKHTMSVVEAKVGEEIVWAEEAFSPGILLRDNLIRISCVAGLVGYLMGSSQSRRLVGPIVLVSFGYVIWRVVLKNRLEDRNRADLPGLVA
jgi:hypothetical protein